MDSNPEYSKIIYEVESEFNAYKKSLDCIFSPAIISFPAPIFPSITAKSNPISCSVPYPVGSAYLVISQSLVSILLYIL